MKKAALIDVAKQKNVYTEEMDKPSTSKAAIIEVLMSADAAIASGITDPDTPIKE
jgi:hypothetical protein